jgi:hypothetical protein
MEYQGRMLAPVDETGWVVMEVTDLVEVVTFAIWT